MLFSTNRWRTGGKDAAVANGEASGDASEEKVKMKTTVGKDQSVEVGLSIAGDLEVRSVDLGLSLDQLRCYSPPDSSSHITHHVPSPP